MKKVFLSVSMILVVSFILAQDTSSTGFKEAAINLYLDCNFCDFDYIRDHLPYVNYVRDRKEADVHLLISRQSTGSGGSQYTLFFIGQEKYKGHNDTLVISLKPKSTDDEKREKLLSFIQMGLVSYVAKTPFADKLNINYSSDATEVTPIDKWDSWVFVLNEYGYVNGDETYKDTYFNSSIQANRVTEATRTSIYGRINYNRSLYNLEDTTLINVNRSSSFGLSEIISLSDHWSAKGSGSIYNSDYSNIKLSASINTGIEYNLFKYAESTRRQLRIQYFIGGQHSDYIDTTVYNKIEEYLVEQTLAGAFQIKETWGTINSSVTYSNYLHDFSLNHLNFYLSLSINIVKNLSLTFYGSYSYIHDQVSLQKADASQEEILTHIKQLKSHYSYYGNIGLSYSFGSIYNNVVNPRFGN